MSELNKLKQDFYAFTTKYESYMLKDKAALSKKMKAILDHAEKVVQENKELKLKLSTYEYMNNQISINA